MSLATLFGKLQEHGMELLRLNQHEESDKKKKGIALKAVNVCVWRFWWCEDKSNISFISSPNQDQENKDQEES